jgi:hypothetical protein
LKRSALLKDGALCEKYEALTLQHLAKVAQLMSPKQGERFLNDFTPTVKQQRLQHQRELAKKVR